MCACISMRSSGRVMESDVLFGHLMSRPESDVYVQLIYLRTFNGKLKKNGSVASSQQNEMRR
jgi:hypothetical protein